MNPALVAAGDVTSKRLATLAPGATGASIVTGARLPPEATAVHPAGRERLTLTPTADAPVVFVNVTVTSCVVDGVNVVTRDSPTRCTSYPAATMLACTASVVASDG